MRLDQPRSPIPIARIGNVPERSRSEKATDALMSHTEQENAPRPTSPSCAIVSRLIQSVAAKRLWLLPGTLRQARKAPDQTCCISARLRRPLPFRSPCINSEDPEFTIFSEGVCRAEP